MMRDIGNIKPTRLAKLNTKDILIAIQHYISSILLRFFNGWICILKNCMPPGIVQEQLLIPIFIVGEGQGDR